MNDSTGYTTVCSGMGKRCVSILHSGRAYHVSFDGNKVYVAIIFRGGHIKSSIVSNEAAAYSWLGDHGLKRGKIKRLLADARPYDGIVIKSS